MGLDMVEDAVSLSIWRFDHEICRAAFKLRHAFISRISTCDITQKSMQSWKLGQVTVATLGVL